MKKNQLYTVSKWNKNLFEDGGVLGVPWLDTPQQTGLPLANPMTGLSNIKGVSVMGSTPSQTVGIQAGQVAMKPVDVDPEGVSKGIASGIGKSMLNAGIGAAANVVGGIGNKAISGGLSSGAGSAISSIGSTVGGAISAVNPVLGAAVSVGSNILGGLTNRAFGMKTDEKALREANSGTSYLANFSSTASNFDDVAGPTAVAGIGDVYKGGWFSSGKAAKKNRQLQEQRDYATNWADRSVENNINNIMHNQTNSLLANYSAFGGPIDTGDMGAIEYGFMSDYLARKKEEANIKNKMAGITPMPAFMPNSFAIGGDLQTNGADFSDGLTIIGAGGLHETNPYEGIQLGTDGNGTPNLVEENETVYNDYVFSNRILADAATKQLFKLPKKKDITYADISKRLEKEIAERPNDPISKSSFEKQMQMLEEQQERQKQEMEAERAREAFEALSPEEKVAVLQQYNRQQEAMAQQALQQQAVGNGQIMQQLSPEEAIAAQQTADGSNPNLGVQPQMNCFGGKIKKFEGGGDLESSDWYKGLTPYYQWAAKTFGIKDEDAMYDVPSSFLDDMENVYNLYQVGDNQKTNFDALHSASSFSDDIYNPIKGMNMQKKTFNDITPDQWINVYNNYMKDYNAFSKQYPTIPYGSRMDDVYRKQWDTTYEGYIGNSYADGGKLKERIYRLLGVHTDSGFKEWFNKNIKRNNGRGADYKVVQNLIDEGDFDKLRQNDVFWSAVSKGDAALADAISRGYDFGYYKPSNNDVLSFDFKHGGWGKEDYGAWDGSTDAAWQEAMEKGLVKEGMTSKEIGDALMQTDAYKRGTSWLQDNEDNRLQYLQSILNSPDAPEAARNYAARYVDANGWKQGVARDYDTIFGTVRSTHPGTYWKTPGEMLRGNVTGNLVINPDGTIEQIYGDVPLEWESAGKYSWAAPDNNYAYNYYRIPGSGNPREATKSPVGNGTVAGDAEDTLNGGVSPKIRKEWPRYLGLFGPAVGLGLQAAGIGRPDYKGLDAALSTLEGGAHLADYQTIGDYLNLTPMDVLAEQNRQNASARAAERAILNSGAPQGVQVAGILANDYNSQLANGQLFRQGLEYNNGIKTRNAEFNRGTNQFNAEAYNRNSQFNAEALNRNRQTNAQLQAEIAGQKLAADAGWYNSLYGNIGGLFEGLSELGRENAMRNQVARMAANSIFGTMTPDTPVAYDYLTYNKNNKKKGGK